MIETCPYTALAGFSAMLVDPKGFSALEAFRFLENPRPSLSDTSR